MTDETSFTYTPQPVQPVADIMKPVIDRAIRARIAALTDLEMGQLSERLADLWLSHGYDHDTARTALLSLLAPETTEEPTGCEHVWVSVLAGDRAWLECQRCSVWYDEQTHGSAS